MNEEARRRYEEATGYAWTTDPETSTAAAGLVVTEPTDQEEAPGSYWGSVALLASLGVLTAWALLEVAGRG